MGTSIEFQYTPEFSRIPNDNYSPHGKVVVQSYMERSGEGICALERRWRKHFLETMRPKFLPPLWSIEHQGLTNSLHPTKFNCLS